MSLMDKDILTYFTTLDTDSEQERRMLKRTANHLRRGGIHTMSELCLQYEQSPEQIVDIRNIGAKSFIRIGEICSKYINYKTTIN